MRQGNVSRNVVPPCLDCVRHIGFCRLAQVPALGIGADEQRRADFAERFDQRRSPCGGADARRRAVGGMLVVSRKAECHARKRNTALVIELVARYTHPGPKPVAAGVVERLSAQMDPKSRRLARDKDLRRRRNMEHRTGLEFGRANPAGANLGDESRKLVLLALHGSSRNRARAMTICWIWLVPS